MSQITSFSSIKPSMLRVKSSIYIVWPPILLLKLELLNVHRKGPPNNKSVALTVRFVEDSSIVRQNIIWGPGRISKAQAHAGGPPLRDCQAVPRKKGKGCHWRCSWLGLKPEGWWDEDPWAFVFFFFGLKHGETINQHTHELAGHFRSTSVIFVLVLWLILQPSPIHAVPIFCAGLVWCMGTPKKMPHSVSSMIRMYVSPCIWCLSENLQVFKLFDIFPGLVVLSAASQGCWRPGTRSLAETPSISLGRLVTKKSPFSGSICEFPGGYGPWRVSCVFPVWCISV